MQQYNKNLTLFITGGILYIFIELLWRGYTHPSMFILGGVCFILIGLINEFFTFKMELWKQQIIAAFLVTAAELTAGLILNIYLGLNIWDYSNLKFNFLGQISLEYCVLWFLLSLPAIMLDDYLRHWLFKEEKPYYKF